MVDLDKGHPADTVFGINTAQFDMGNEVITATDVSFGMGAVSISTVSVGQSRGFRFQSKGEHIEDPVRDVVIRFSAPSEIEIMIQKLEEMKVNWLAEHEDT